MRSKIAGHAGAVLVFAEGTTQAYGPPMADKMRPGAIEAAFDSGKLVQPVRARVAAARMHASVRVRAAMHGRRLGLVRRPAAAPRLVTPLSDACCAWVRLCAIQAVIYYSARIGWGFGPESNGLRQTALMCARPTVAALQLCPALRPADFPSAEAMAAAAQRSMLDAYAHLEQRYQDWPTDRIASPPAM